MSVETTYHRFFAVTGNEIAAALLTLAESRQDDSLLTVDSAANLLGLKPAGLRKLVKSGQIRHVQNGRGPIKFRREWVDAYIQASNPTKVERSPSQRRPAPTPKVSGFDPRLFKN